ncbi:putative kinase-like protein TMKL1 [Rhodamnia argentea]|uniref:Kinase-like protein TMKL1 n=1 Tax=Rhodamnia argentea TaxID=178133 RepID=A0A8B8PKF3_9MYRT|nr:putative kinase-like protein TMKL1 [Rhodamnia argentea]
MRNTHTLKLVFGLAAAAAAFALFLFFYFYRNVSRTYGQRADLENSDETYEDQTEVEDLMTFQGSEDLTIGDILEAPGEVIGKSSYGTLYRAVFDQSNSLKLLRFLRPVCVTRSEEFAEVIETLGSVRHPNLVPLLGFYSGPRGEKLLVYPFYRKWNLAEFIRDGSKNSLRWATIYEISMGIAEGLDHLHTGLMKPIIHGNLKSKNIFLDHNHRSYVSDFGLHLLLNPMAGQEMLEALAAEGYKAPELIKMKEASADSDIYSLGVILLEMLTGKEPINGKASSDEEFYLPNYIRSAVLGRRVSELYHPEILSSNGGGSGGVSVSEERVLKLSQLAMACCSPSPSLRPTAKQVLWKLEEIGK